MKRATFVLLCMCPALVLFHDRCRAAPSYGTALPEKKQFFWGLQTHTLIDRDLEDSFGSMRSVQHFLLISYGVTEWFCVDLKGGTGSIKQHPVGSNEIDYPSSFAGGYGFRLQLYDNREGKVRVVCGFQHISVHPRSIHLAGVKNRAILDDWQVSLLASKEIGQITPYFGYKWSRLDYIHWIDERRKRRMSDSTESAGMVVGIDIPFFFDTRLNGEGHFFDEKAASIAVMRKF